MKTPPDLFLSCLFGQSLLMVIVGAALMFFGRHLVAVGIGLAMIADAVLLTLFTLWLLLLSKGIVARVYRQKLLRVALVLTSFILNLFVPVPLPNIDERANDRHD